MLGQLRLANATPDLLKCLLQRDNDQYESPTQFDCKVLDGAIIIHCLPTIEASLFDEYADIHTASSIAAQKMQAYRCCMRHIRGRQPLEAASEKRGEGKRRKVAGQTKLQNSG